MRIDHGSPLAARVPAGDRALVSIAGSGPGTRIVTVAVRAGSSSPVVHSLARRNFDVIFRAALGVGVLALAAGIVGLVISRRRDAGLRIAPATEANAPPC